jgi:tRNA-dihydrouridine synthase A
MSMVLVACVVACSRAARVVQPVRHASFGRAAPTAQLDDTSLPASELFSVAPMMEYTDRHFRHMMRLVTSRAVLYSEMVVSNAVHHNRGTANGIDRWYACTDGAEFGGPRDVLQLGGSDPLTLATASREALAYPYSAINLNCGCPSERVAGSGAFGASLMRDPHHVAKLCDAMAEATRGALPITVKCRIGVDDDDSYESLRGFVDAVSAAGVRHFIVHARKAILNMKLTPAENRVVPPLKHEYVHALASDYATAGVRFTLNGGIGSLGDAAAHLARSPNLAGIMIGRDVVNRPFYYAHADRVLYAAADDARAEARGGRDGAASVAGSVAPSRAEVLTSYAAYARAQLAAGARESALIKPVHNLFHGAPGARAFRRELARVQAEEGGRAAVYAFEEAARKCVPEPFMAARADADAWDAPEREAATGGSAPADAASKWAATVEGMRSLGGDHADVSAECSSASRR